MGENDPDRQQDLRKVLDIARMMAATVDLDSLLRLIIDRGMELLDAERASLFLYEPASHELVSRIAAGAGEIRFPADRGVAGATIAGGATIVVPDAYADPRFNPEVDRNTRFVTQNILSVPLRDHDGRIVGVLQVLYSRSGGFSEYGIWLAETLAAQAGVSIQRARLIEHYLQKQEMERAMRIARDIQRGLLPKAPPDIEGFDIAGFTQPADDTGGDVYDFFPLPEGRWMFVVADASGHGIGPALVIAETRAMLRATALRGDDVATLLATTNSLLERDLEGRFVTCFLGLLDPATGTLVYGSAGHGPLLFYRRAADEFTEVSATGLPLGIVPGVAYDKVPSFRFQSGDFAAVITDGFFEADDPAGKERFGVPRLIELLRRDRDAPAAEMIANLHRAVVAFSGRAVQADDLTAVVVKKT